MTVKVNKTVKQKLKTNIKNGKLTLSIDQQLGPWKEYLEELFTDERPESHLMEEVSEAPTNCKRRNGKVFARPKARKFTGADEIPNNF